MYKLSEETKKTACQILGLSTDKDDDEIISTYLEEIDDETYGHVDPRFARSVAMCDPMNFVNRSIDSTIKHHKSKNRKHQPKQTVNDDSLCK